MEHNKSGYDGGCMKKILFTIFSFLILLSVGYSLISMMDIFNIPDIIGLPFMFMFGMMWWHYSNKFRKVIYA